MYPTYPILILFFFFFFFAHRRLVLVGEAFCPPTCGAPGSSHPAHTAVNDENELGRVLDGNWVSHLLFWPYSLFQYERKPCPS